eukprot:COSAG06_NODE_57271_length_281_cov_0.571429_1_plen_87_part_01
MSDARLQKQLLTWLSSADKMAQRKSTGAFGLNGYEALVFNCCRFGIVDMDTDENAGDQSKSPAIESLDTDMDKNTGDQSKSPVIEFL